MTSDGIKDKDVPGTIPLAIVAAGTILAGAINVWTRVHDQPELASGARLWEPLLWETSSLVMTLVLLPLAWRAVLATERGASRVAVAFQCFAYGLAFAVLHVVGFVLLRWTVYASMGRHYVFGGAQGWFYELPKDLVTFAIVAGILLTGRRFGRTIEPGEARPDRPEPLRIKDGNRTFLVEPGELLAANASGNYVEFHLTDGRKPLSRSRLGEAEALLAQHGFLKTHRSWLVNRSHVREIRSTGSGDHELIVGTGLKVPVSRRFAPEVLAACGAARSARAPAPLVPPVRETPR